MNFLLVKWASVCRISWKMWSVRQPVRIWAQWFYMGCSSGSIPNISKSLYVENVIHIFVENCSYLCQNGGYCNAVSNAQGMIPTGELYDITSNWVSQMLFFMWQFSRNFNSCSDVGVDSLPCKLCLIYLLHTDNNFRVFIGSVTNFNGSPFNWFLMAPSIGTKFQYVNSPFIFLFTTCFGHYGPSSGEIYN
jgi:hypothetical protein